MKLKKMLDKAYDVVSDMDVKPGDDNWVQINKNWDMNVWEDEDEKIIHAALYPIQNGQTITTFHYIVLL